jgi:hypothetical protein
VEKLSLFLKDAHRNDWQFHCRLVGTPCSSPHPEGGFEYRIEVSRRELANWDLVHTAIVETHFEVLGGATIDLEEVRRHLLCPALLEAQARLAGLLWTAATAPLWTKATTEE